MGVEVRRSVHVFCPPTNFSATSRLDVLEAKIWHRLFLLFVTFFLWAAPLMFLFIVQLGLGFKLNTKIGLHTYPPTHHTNFLKGSRPSRRLRFGMLTLLTKI